MSLPSTRSTNPRTVRNVVANWGAFAFAIGVNFFLSPFIVHRLGDTPYGIWVLLASLVGYMGLLDLGVQSAVMRYVARYHAQRRDEEARRILSAGLAIFTAIGLTTLLLSVVLAVFVLQHLQIPADLLDTARQVLIITGFAVAASFVGGVFGGVVSALQRFDLASAVEVAIGLARAVAIIVTLEQGGGLVALALVQLGVSVLRAAAAWGLAHRLYPELRVSLRNWGWGDLRLIFTFGVFSSLLHVSNKLVTQADSLIIASFLPVGLVTFFAIAASLTGYATSIVSAIARTVTPRVGALQATADPVVIRRVVLQLGRAATLVILPVTITFLLRGDRFLGLWMGPEYADLSGAVLRPLALALTFSAGPHVTTSALIGLNRHRDFVPFAIAEAVINIGLSILWIGTLGIVGMAIATAVPRLSLCLIVTPWLLQRHMGASALETWRELWGRPFAAAVPFALVTWLTEQRWPADSLTTYFVQVVAALPFMAVGIWLVGLPAADRLQVRAALRRPWHAWAKTR